MPFSNFFDDAPVNSGVTHGWTATFQGHHIPTAIAGESDLLNLLNQQDLYSHSEFARANSLCGFQWQQHAIDANWYMTLGPGRFAKPSLSPLIQQFFEKDANGNYVHSIPGQATAYTKAEIVPIRSSVRPEMTRSPVVWATIPSTLLRGLAKTQFRTSRLVRVLQISSVFLWGLHSTVMRKSLRRHRRWVLMR